VLGHVSGSHIRTGIVHPLVSLSVAGMAEVGMLMWASLGDAAGSVPHLYVVKGYEKESRFGEYEELHRLTRD